MFSPDSLPYHFIMYNCKVIYVSTLHRDQIILSSLISLHSTRVPCHYTRNPFRFAPFEPCVPLSPYASRSPPKDAALWPSVGNHYSQGGSNNHRHVALTPATQQQERFNSSHARRLHLTGVTEAFLENYVYSKTPNVFRPHPESSVTRRGGRGSWRGKGWRGRRKSPSTSSFLHVENNVMTDGRQLVSRGPRVPALPRRLLSCSSFVLDATLPLPPSLSLFLLPSFLSLRPSVLIKVIVWAL